MLLLTVSSFTILAQNFANPNFNGAASSMLSVLPQSWQNVPASDPVCQVSISYQGLGDTPDMTNIYGPMSNTGIVGTPNMGDNFISGVRGNNFHEGIMQTVSGFIPGNQYKITFYQAVVKQENCLDTTGAWSVYMDTTLVGISALTTSHLAYNDPLLNWEEREIFFVATQSSHTFKFLPYDDDTNLNITSYELNAALRMGIDQFELTEVTYPTYYYDTTYCSVGNYNISLNYPNATYLWDDNSTGNTKLVHTSGIHTVEVTTPDSTFYNQYEVKIFEPSLATLPNDTVMCLGDTLLLHSPQNSYPYYWQNGSTSSSIEVYNTQEVEYTMYHNQCSSTAKMTVTVAPVPQINLNDTNLCYNEYFTTNLNPNYAYTWNDGSQTNNYSINSSGSYTVEVSNGFCASTETFNVHIVDSLSFEGFTDTNLCFGEEVVFSAPQGDFDAVWNDGSTGNLIVNQSGIYTLNLSNACQSKDFPVHVNVSPEIILSLGNDTTLCPDETIILSPQSNVTGTYTWQDGNNNSEYAVNAPGIYTLTLDHHGCSVTDTLEVNYTAPLNINLGNDTSICSLSQLQLTASTEESWNYSWSEGSTENSLWVTESGYYAVSVSNSCESTTDEIYVLVEDCQTNVFAPNTFTPNGDRHNNTFQFISEDDFDRFEWQIYNRWGELIFTGNSKDDVWDGSYHNQICPDGSYVWKLTYSVSGSAYVEQKTGTITLLS